MKAFPDRITSDLQREILKRIEIKKLERNEIKEKVKEN